jgi:chorismate synthase
MLHKINFLTAGESHGKSLVGIIDGLPAGIQIDEEYLKYHLNRRQKGFGRGDRMKIESDQAEILSGVRYGKTTGAPISLLIPNRDWENWKEVMSVAPVAEETKSITTPRPGHADLAGLKKFDSDDIRNILERSSARETAMRVGLGSICRKLLESVNIEIGSRVIQIHNAVDNSEIPEEINPFAMSEIADKSPVRCLDKDAEKDMIEVISKAKEAGDSVGGVFEIIAKGLPFGLGSHTQWSKKLQARISEAILSINAIKGVEIGLGFESTLMTGSQVHDEIFSRDKTVHRLTNNAGGIEGGMSNTQPLVVKAVMKPIPTLSKPLQSVDLETGEKYLAFRERADSCAVPAASIIAESMIAIVLADALLEKFGGDSLEQLKAHMNSSARY